jgi:hypothetical protein
MERRGGVGPTATRFWGWRRVATANLKNRPV